MSSARIARLVAVLAFFVSWVAHSAPPRIYADIISATLRDGGTLHAGLGRIDGDVAAYSFAAWKVRPDGTPDPGFNHGDPVFIPVWGYYEAASMIFEQTDGRIVLGGQAADPLYREDLTCYPAFCHVHPAFIRLNADGSLDLSFNGTGKFVALAEMDEETLEASQDADGIALRLGKQFLGRIGPDGRPQSGLVEYPSADAQGMWGGIDARSGSVQFAFSQQEEILFGVLLDSGVSPPQWQVFALPRIAPMKYRGRLLQTTARISWVAGGPLDLDIRDVGELTVTFLDRGLAEVVAQDMDGFVVPRTIARSEGPQGCAFGADPDLRRAGNLTDFWNVKPLGAEPGWALFLNQNYFQDVDLLWLTYDANGRPTWLAGTLPLRDGAIKGALQYRGSHAADISITVRDGNEIDFAYSMDAGVPWAGNANGRSTMTRFVYRAPGTSCR